MAKLVRLLAEMQIPPGWEETLQFLLADAGWGTALADWQFPSGAVGEEASLTGRPADRVVLVLDAAREPEFRDDLNAWARQFGWSADDWQLTTELRELDDDAEAWKRHWRPFRCAGFEISAPFHDAKNTPHREGCIRLILEVGSAFGTGSHATTRLALRAMREEFQLRAPSAMLDVGTGSGILAVAAALLGIARVEGMDPDPQSAPQAGRMAARNHVDSQCAFWQGRLESATGEWPLVMANLVADLHIDVAPELAARVAPEGALIAGGIRAEHLAVTTKAFESAGLALERSWGRGRWRGITLRRGDSFAAN